MTLYVDTSGLLKRYIAERDSDIADELMATDPVLVTSRLTEVELRRNLTRLLEGDHLLAARRLGEPEFETGISLSGKDRDGALFEIYPLESALDLEDFEHRLGPVQRRLGPAFEVYVPADLGTRRGSGCFLRRQGEGDHKHE